MAQRAWVDTISVKGDVRLRYEGIDEEGEEETEMELPDLVSAEDDDTYDEEDIELVDFD